MAPVSLSAHAGGLPLAGKVVAIDPGHNPNNWKHLAEIDKPCQGDPRPPRPALTNTDTTLGTTAPVVPSPRKSAAMAS